MSFADGQGIDPWRCNRVREGASESTPSFSNKGGALRQSGISNGNAFNTNTTIENLKRTNPEQVEDKIAKSKFIETEENTEHGHINVLWKISWLLSSPIALTDK